MHQNSTSFHLLAECANGYIGECTCCREFNFAYKNILLAFQEEEMCRFLEWLVDSRYHPDTFQPLPHQRDRVYCSPLSNMYLAFSLEELEEVEALFGQARLMLEARKIISDSAS
ncbi:hypothetical protein KK083_27655 [Fulvivirgaceae bacterium PWU4]|uniref:Uncharacterized protein n=1 Tax=Chryseosolibacter histidini TaxID=2782349 RepID=A0AAP2DT33_9BACT|nr:DUF6686 family protein [Chryseosolibacter histidini]MBT1700697.1 hypothetical protein [Chryseosolibacter histidini]